VIEGVIKRSRIRTGQGLSYTDPYLDVKTSCLTAFGGYAIYMQIRFAKGFVLWDSNFGGIMTAPEDDSGKQYLLNNLRDSLEEAITDFVEVNFLSDPN